jgi:membrane fusion protein, copper/silver efflux system
MRTRLMGLAQWTVCGGVLAWIAAHPLWAADGGSGRAEGEATAAEAPATAGFSRAPIRLTPGQRQEIGLRYATAARQAMTMTIRTVGRVDWDERRLAYVTLKVEGYIEDLFVDYTGKKVRKGDPLFTIYSPDLVTAEQEYLLARQTEERLKTSTVPGAAASAASTLRASRERLRLWDLSDRQVRALETSGGPMLYQTIYSPVSGVVIEKTAVKGLRVEPGAPLYKIADPSTVWVYADLYEYEARFVKVGQEARISLTSYPGASYVARVAYVYPTLDPKTRTVKVRFQLANSAEAPLRPDMYGDVDLTVPLGERLVVPRDAVLDSGREQVVFLDGGNGLLTPHGVRVGARAGDQVEILEGLRAGERVVASANFLVDSESKLEGAESMMGLMGSIGMGDWKMESARPMEMGGEGFAAAEPSPVAAAAGQDRRVGDFLLSVFPAEASPAVGRRAVRVRVKDASGAPLTGATVSFSYTMDMAGMGIEKAAAKEIGGGVYEGTAELTMAGPWGIVVEVDAPGKAPARGKFTIRVSGRGAEG